MAKDFLILDPNLKQNRKSVLPSFYQILMKQNTENESFHLIKIIKFNMAIRDSLWKFELESWLSGWERSWRHNGAYRSVAVELLCSEHGQWEEKGSRRLPQRFSNTNQLELRGKQGKTARGGITYEDPLDELKHRQILVPWDGSKSENRFGLVVVLDWVF